MSLLRILGTTMLFLSALLLTTGLSKAGEGWEPYGVPARLLPWNQPNYQGYHEPNRPSQPPPPTVRAAAEKYTITIVPLPRKAQGAEGKNVVLMAHVPEDALIWFQDQRTQAKGMVRYFESPPLTPGKHYVYSARLVWHENGKWVSKTTKVPVEAGEMHCIYLTPTAAVAKKVADNLAKLSADDRKLAEAQKFCVIQQSNLLGAMGVPVKITIKGQPVFLCCKGCEELAHADPDKTLAKVKQLQEKAVRTPRR